MLLDVLDGSNPILDMRNSVLLRSSRLCNACAIPPWILKRGGLESSGRRLISPRGRLEIPYQIQRARLLYLLSQYATNIHVSSDCYSFMTDISRYNSQLTSVFLLHTEKRGQTVLPYVFIMEFPTSPLAKLR